MSRLEPIGEMSMIVGVMLRVLKLTIERPLRLFWLVARHVGDSKWDQPWWFRSCSEVIVGLGTGS